MGQEPLGQLDGFGGLHFLVVIEVCRPLGLGPRLVLIVQNGSG
jgi:hypothetical protein